MFPSHEELPRFAWIETRNNRSGTYQYMDIEYELDLSGGNLFNVRASIALPPVNDSRNKRALRNKLIVHYRDHFQVDGSAPNQSIITATKGKQKVQWKGPLVVLAHKVDGTRDPPFDDATAHDLRDVVDWLCRYDGSAASVSPLQPIFDIKAFRINSPAHIRATNAPEFVPVTIKSDHPIFSKRQNMERITTSLGFPLHVYQLAPHAWDAVDDDTPNLAAMCLEIQTSGPRIGHCSLEWAGAKSKSSALVARVDKKDLLIQHIQTLTSYCENEVAPALASLAYAQAWDHVKELFDQECTAENFEALWVWTVWDKQIKAAYGYGRESDRPWLDCPSPFEIQGGPML